ncbi:C39 family peptidase [Thiothrix winogradskyi]|uniref:C39 family peptidase n=1 Tax=Thiothrix winogradskyi TaxID=96472 RepID=A0ABY3SZG8_9GAMM|nr:C39 family peptidase [Thiothrix winogradskyi]UJS24936.1 C39 family peptidase [Thiothrix winogradskyi]
MIYKVRHNLPILLAIFLSACTVEPIVSNMGYAVNASGDHFKSWKELNDQSVVMQQYDYSCGAAALATIMKYYFQDDVTEKSLLDYIKATLTAEEYAVVEEHGLSFLELEKISHSLGYQSASVRLQLSALKELAGPVVVYVSTKDYQHFAVFRGVREDRIFLADPSRGNMILTVDEFLGEWKGETFILGKKGFGTPAQHPLAVMLSPKFRNEMELIRASALKPVASATKMVLE